MRLVTLKQIRDEKFPMSRSWIFASIAKGDFPKAINSGAGPNLWDEADIDRFVAEFVDAAKVRAAAGEGAKRSAKALAARVSRHEQLQAGCNHAE